MTTTQTAAAGWLAHSHPRPAEVYRDWNDRNASMLPAGTRWDAIKLLSNKVAADYVLELLQQLGLEGPLSHDPMSGAFYVLVPLGSAASWNRQGTEVLSSGSYLVTPPPDRTQPPGPYWLIPPDGDGQLTDPDFLRNALNIVWISGMPCTMRQANQ